MAAKYESLTRFLADQMPDEAVSVTIAEIDRIVGGLPPSARQRTWWANTTGHSQAVAWLAAGRRVTEVQPGHRVVFSPAVTGIEPGMGFRPAGASRAILDGVAALEAVVAKAGYASIVEAVAAHTLFLHPETVAQTGGRALFPVVRDPARRGQIDHLDDGHFVLLDDNTTPTLSLLWAAQRAKGKDVQYNHVWGDPRNRMTYTALWNLCVTPAFVAKTTDGSNHPEVLAALRFRSFDLYGTYPAGEQAPTKPPGYDRLCWPDPPDPVTDLEGVFRQRLAAAPRSRPAVAARRIGWLFSGWRPDATVPDPNVG